MGMSSVVAGKLAQAVCGYVVCLTSVGLAGRGSDWTSTKGLLWYQWQRLPGAFELFVLCVTHDIC